MTTLIKRTVVSLMLLNALGPMAWADGAGTSGAEVLKIGVGARAIGMGEAYTAQADDVSSLHWNPAGLALMQERQASFMYNQMVNDLKFQNLAIGFPLENGAIGGSLSYLSYGSIEGFDTAGNSMGDLDTHSAVATLGAAYLGNSWSAGINAKGVQEKFADESANAFAVDLGVNAIVPRPILNGTLRVGGVLQNLGQDMKFIDQKNPLPRQWKVGVAGVQMINRKLNLSLDYGKPRDDSGVVSFGAEYWLVKYLALRAGYINSDVEGNGARAGLGLRIRGIAFDYAYANQGDLGMNHRYELSFRFGEPRPILTPEQRKIYQQAKSAQDAERYEQAVLLYDSLLEMVPRFKPARRNLKYSMAKLEGTQTDRLARQGQRFNPNTAQGAKRQTLPEMDDLENLLNLGTPKAAQTPPAKGAADKGGN